MQRRVCITGSSYLDPTTAAAFERINFSDHLRSLLRSLLKSQSGLALLPRFAVASVAIYHRRAAGNSSEIASPEEGNAPLGG
jgi:hypothetical protein